MTRVDPDQSVHQHSLFGVYTVRHLVREAFLMLLENLSGLSKSAYTYHNRKYNYPYFGIVRHILFIYYDIFSKCIAKL